MNLGAGMVSKVYLNNGVVAKHYFKPFEKYVGRNIKWHWKAEIKALRKLKGKKHFPQLISEDHNNKIIYMSYCGDPLTKENLPKDWKKQCTEIENTLYKEDIYHQDLTGTTKGKQHHKNIHVKDGIIYLIDFGIWANKFSQGFNTVTDMVSKLA